MKIPILIEVTEDHRFCATGGETVRRRRGSRHAGKLHWTK